MNEEIIKPQWVRLIDVFILGPFIMYAGVSSKDLHPVLKGALVMAGGGTIIYNGHNFLKIRKMKRAQNGG